MPVIRSNGYRVIIGKESFRAINTFLDKNDYSSCFILCDENSFQHCLPKLITLCPELRKAGIIEIESGEASKSLEFCSQIWRTLIEYNADRKTLLVNLGGGVISDLGGFAASVYKRGIDFINIPTTLLAMADASIGGKTGIDFYNLKNSIGTFAQPKGVFIYPEFIYTLTERHFENGLLEIYKMGLICDREFLDYAENSHGFGIMIHKSLSLKNKIVLKDPFEKGIRKILNFGHTLGHALEALRLGTEKELLHGEAVMVGMILESHISFQKKVLSKTDLNRVLSAFRYFQKPDLKDLAPDELIVQVKNDKKNRDNKLYFSLIDKIGSCKFDIAVSEAQIRRSIGFYNALNT